MGFLELFTIFSVVVIVCSLIYDIVREEDMLLIAFIGLLIGWILVGMGYLITLG